MTDVCVCLSSARRPRVHAAPVLIASRRRTARRHASSPPTDFDPAATPLQLLTFATGAFVRWLERLHLNLRLLALPNARLSVCAGDASALQAARGMGLFALDFSRGLNRGCSDAERFGSQGFNRIVHAKSTCVHAQLVRLEPPSLLFFLDGDVTLFGDPRPSFLSMGVDFALMSDNIGSREQYFRNRPPHTCHACKKGSAQA